MRDVTRPRGRFGAERIVASGSSPAGCTRSAPRRESDARPRASVAHLSGLRGGSPLGG